MELDAAKIQGLLELAGAGPQSNAPDRSGAPAPGLPGEPDVECFARAIRFRRPGTAELLEGLPIPAATDGQATVRILVSVTSPGTERARYLRLPNATVKFPHFPGYLAAGVLAEDAPPLPAGTPVAMRHVGHQSLAVVPIADLHPVPVDVPLVDAALWHLGLIALYGLARGPYQAGEPLAVVGGGLVGTMTRRLALARGTKSCLVVASSSDKRWALETETGTRFLLAEDSTAGTEARRHPLVIDTTGTAAGLVASTQLAADGGRVVLLGSPRATLAPLPIREIHDRGLRIIGAHIRTMPGAAAPPSDDAEPRLTETYFDLLSGGASFSDVLAVHRPEDAALVYRELAADRSLIGAAFDWTHEPASEPDGHGSAIPAPHRRADPAPSGALRFALLGCGDIGRGDAAALAGARGPELVVCHDPVQALAEQAAERHGAVAAGSVAEALDRSDVDAVLIATPHDTHEQLVAAALGAGKAVLLEKPLSCDLASAVRIRGLAQHASQPTGVLFPLRYDDRFLAARDAIDRGYLGEPLAGLSTYLSDKEPSYYFGGYRGRSPSTWRTSKARSGGGVLMMNLVHHVDAIRALLGEDATSVTAEFVSGRLAPEVDDVASLVARFGAAVVTFVGGASVVQGPGQSIRLWGTAGQLTVVPEMSVSSLVGGSPTVPVAKRGNSPRTLAIEAFAGAVTRGARPDVTVDDALAVQAVVAGAYAAAETRTMVRRRSCSGRRAYDVTRLLRAHEPRTPGWVLPRPRDGLGRLPGFG